jgi:hypothetical protein
MDNGVSAVAAGEAVHKFQPQLTGASLCDGFVANRQKFNQIPPAIVTVY